MHAQYMSKENGSSAAVGKFFKKYMLICLRKYPFLPFCIAKFNLKSWVPPFLVENLPPLLVSPPQIFFRFPPFWNFQNLGSQGCVCVGGVGTHYVRRKDPRGSLKYNKSVREWIKFCTIPRHWLKTFLSPNLKARFRKVWQSRYASPP